MEQFKNDILYRAICLEEENDYLGYLTDLVKISIANKGECINEKTPAILRDDILNAIGRIKKLKVLLSELARSGYTIRGSNQYPDYNFYNDYFKKSIARAKLVLKKLDPYLTKQGKISCTFAIGELSPGY